VQLAQYRDRLLGVRHRGAFGDFELEKLRREAGAGSFAPVWASRTFRVATPGEIQSG
jgi:hypothetical protein